LREHSKQSLTKTFVFSTLALLAFAANSVLCKLALGNNSIDAASFTAIRLLSGALVLLFILRFGKSTRGMTSKGNWVSSVMLFLYAITFSFAYISLDTGTGALILFGSVQLTMIVFSVILGNKLHRSEWLGIFIAFTGLVYLVLPDVSTPSFMGFLLMTVAGIAWGIYTLQGKDSINPLKDTAYNFLRTTPIVLILLTVTFYNAHYSFEGIVLAILSGAIASAIGYTIWYLALSGLSATQAAVIQLSVPVIAALGGVVFISEVLTLRLILSASLILSGVLIVILGRHYVLKLNQSDNQV
jgi:drug/metabolite transporter (DMT)-like permease